MNTAGNLKMNGFACESAGSNERDKGRRAGERIVRDPLIEANQNVT
jgi:hypothetical protein